MDKDKLAGASATAASAVPITNFKTEPQSKDVNSIMDEEVDDYTALNQYRSLNFEAVRV